MMQYQSVYTLYDILFTCLLILEFTQLSGMAFIICEVHLCVNIIFLLKCRVWSKVLFQVFKEFMHSIAGGANDTINQPDYVVIQWALGKTNLNKNCLI